VNRNRGDVNFRDYILSGYHCLFSNSIVIALQMNGASTASCNVGFLIFPILATFQSGIIKIRMISNLICGTSIATGQSE
jgi:hypothetical protein